MSRTWLVGVAAAAAVVAIGSGWQLATRFGVSTTLTPLDLALLRYAIPTLVLAPLLVRNGVIPVVNHWWVLPAMLAGGGLPFGLLGMAGAQYAPVAHMGALLSGAMPLFVAALSAAAFGQRFSRAQQLGFATIIAGLAVLVGPTLFDAGVTESGGLWRGQLLFLGASMLWAVYTVAYRKSELAPWYAAAVIAFWSTILAIPFWLFSVRSALFSAPLTDVLLQVVMQGIVAGIMGLAMYGLAIRRLGASAAAMTGALVPPCTAVGGIVLLSEPITVATTIGVMITALGVALAAGGGTARRR